MAENSKSPEAYFVIDGERYDVIALRDSFGKTALDITGLYEKKGVMMLDKGYSSTAGCKSAITYINGKEGILLYRGYPIDEIAQNCTFVETAYLLLNGELPTRDELSDFEHSLKYDRKGQLRGQLSEQMIEVIKRHRRDTPPMLLIADMVMGLVPQHAEIATSSPDDLNEVALNLIAKIPTIVATAHRHTSDRPIIYPRSDLNYSENFLRMCFADSDGAPYEVSPIVARALDRIFILHADHEQNASTSTVRLSGSTGVSPYPAVATGVISLWGPKHGGANKAVLDMLQEIGSVEKIPDFLDKVKDKKTGVLLMGFGHRVYKNFDPRAKIMAKTCHEILDLLDLKDPLLDIAKALEKQALKDDYFIQKNLYPNVDFYSGIVMRAMGFPSNMFTALFALARTTGWAAQWKEMVEEGRFPIGRPRQHYTGLQVRHMALKQFTP